MATAAFKSNSKRTTDTSKTNPNPKPKIRRSLSVNALSRSTQLDISTEFLNKRDNPLYWGDNNTEPVDVGALDISERGRSVKRGGLDLKNGGEKVGGRRRSLSRVDRSGGGRRGRSVVSRDKLASEVLKTLFLF